MSVVIQEIPPADPSCLAAFSKIGVATIHEAQGRSGLMAPHMRPILSGAHIAGRAVTVSLPPCDNWMIHVAIEQCQAGDIMVVAPTSFSDAGYFGDLLATLFKARGVAGLIIDAGVRDVMDLRRMGFPVWSACISAQGTVKETLGSVNIPISCAGQIVQAGDIIVADEDGVVVIPHAKGEAVLAASLAREAREAGIRARYAKGELGLDMNNMRPALAEKGLKYV